MNIDPQLARLVAENLNGNVDRLRLKYHGNHLMQQVITQVDCRQRCSRKLPRMLAHSDFLFPSTIAAEQCTSEAVAEIHAGMIDEGEDVIDLTCGLGIDAFSLARRASAVTAIEIDSDKAECARHNAGILSLDNVTIVTADSVEWLNSFQGHAGTVFIDPARRDRTGKRMFGLADCLPDVTAMLPRLRSVCDKVIIKASPMLDIRHTLNSLDGSVTDCYIIGTSTECKELVAVLSMNASTAIDDVMIHVITMTRAGNCHEQYRLGDEDESTPRYGNPVPGMMLTVPYPPGLKGGALKLNSCTGECVKIAPDCHLYIGEKPSAPFAAEHLVIERVIDFNKRGIATVRREYPVINVTTRGMGLQAPELVKRLGIREGGGYRLFGIKDMEGHRLMLVTHP